MPGYPRWQGAVTEPLFRRAVVRGLPLDLSCTVQRALCRALGQPLSRRHWSRMTFNDKVLFRKYCVRDPRLRVVCDKVATREFVVERLGAESVPRALAIAERADELVGLRGPFVLKASHGSGMVIVVDADRCVSADEVAVAQGWLAEDYARWSREWGYQGVRRVLIVEELLASPPPPDYKVFVFDGVARAVQVDESRFSGHVRSMMSMDWTRHGGYVVPVPERVPARPEHWDELVRVAETVAAGFDFLRVDLYDVGGRVLVGELTAYPYSGTGVFSPSSLDREFGRWWTSLPTAG